MKWQASVPSNESRCRVNSLSGMTARAELSATRIEKCLTAAPVLAGRFSRSLRNHSITSPAIRAAIESIALT